MKRAFAIIYKDIRSLKIKSLLFSYALAAVLVCVVVLGLGGLRSTSLLQAFPIAIRNEDDTLISKNIVYQIAKMEIFSEVYRVQEESDEALIQEGYIGVLTIPKDFFYKVYTFDNEPIEIALASSNSIQAIFLQEIIAASMDIITANQVARLGEHTYLYGENIDIDTVHEEASRDILGDLLKRHGIYENEGDIYRMEYLLIYRLASLCIGILALFFTWNTVTSILRDENAGIYARIHICRKDRFLISIWHILYTYLLLLPIVLPMERLLIHNLHIYPLTLLIISIFYAGYACLKIGIRDERLYNRISGLVLIVLIFTSGQIWNINLFGTLYQEIIRHNPIYLMNLSLLTDTLSYMYIIMSGAGILYMIYLLQPSIDIKAPMLFAFPKLCHVRWWKLSVTKAFLIIGRWQGIWWTLAIGGMLAVGFVDMGLPEAERITLGVVDYDKTDRAGELISDLSEDIEVLSIEEKVADRYLMENKIEGKLILTEDGGVILTTSPLSKTKEALKELISAKILSYKVRARIVEDIRIKRGSALSEEEKDDLQEVLSEVAQRIPRVYTVTYFDKEIKESYFMPDIFRFILYIIFLMLLMGIYVVADERARGIEARLTVLAGKGLAFWSDCFAMLLVAVGMGMPLLYFGGIFDGARFAGMLLFTIAISVGLKLLSKFSICKEGAEVFYPIVSLILAFALRCFIDIRL